LTVQLIEIFYPNVFKFYSSKYNIYRDLHENDLLALEIRRVDYKLLQKIKRIVLSNKEICYSTATRGDEIGDLMIIGSYSIFKELSKEIIAIGNEDCGQKVSRTIKNIHEYSTRQMRINGSEFNMECSHAVGILNVTPDSFSDGGRYLDKDLAIAHGLQLLDDGADIIDIGGESTRPGSDPVSEEEELKRVIPVISGILQKRKDALISIDTTKSNVAVAALKAGARIINDISSFDADSKMPEVIKQYNASVILMHMKGTPKNMQDNPNYTNDVVSEVYDYLTSKVEAARRAGVMNIIVDPGIGFGKRLIDNYEIIKRLNEFKGLGAPIMVGLSRKSFIGKVLDLEVDQRDNPTLILETLAIKNGAKFIRTHNVKPVVYASKLNKFIDNPDYLKNV
jgi:dihydropteroate synthase